MSAVNSIYHIVINTYRREMTIPDETGQQQVGETVGLLPHVQRMGQGIWRILVQRARQGENR